LGVWILIAGLLAACASTPASVAPTTAPAAAPTSAPAAAPTAAPSAKPANLTVYAASSLTEAFTEIGREFERQHPGSKVEFNFGGSQQLVQQLAQGAPVDVFASANQTQMDAAVKSGRVVTGTAQTFARNRLIAIYPKEGGTPLTSLQDLAKPNLKLVLAAKEVPVGQYALEFLTRAAADPGFGPQYREAVLRNVVSYEANVRAVLSKVALGEADAGIVYLTDLAGQEAKSVGRLEIPEALHPIAVYPVAAIKDSNQAESAKAFIELVLASEGQKILAKYGFTSR
jgi:molybdate transport system substrate-binding protein